MYECTFKLINKGWKYNY